MIQYIAFGLLWLAWLVSWIVAALWASKPAKRVAPAQSLTYRVLIFLSAVLIFVPAGRERLGLLWFTPLPIGWTLFAIAILGMAFAWWARIHLGTLWSGSITRKADHRVVDTGPYALVRHPIYTGLLLALYVSALDHGTILALLGAVLATVGFVLKLRLEERFLRDELGPEAYDAYNARVPMLVPFWPVNRG